MKRVLFASLIAALSLTACGGGGDYESFEGDVDFRTLESARPGAAPLPAPMMEDAPAFDETGGGAPDVEAPEQYIAYAHRLGLRLPKPAVEPMMQRHLEACQNAGPAVCIITNSSLNNFSDDQVSGQLNLRAKPEWIETFLAGIDGETETAGGEISFRNTTAEDLTRTIIDTGARLTASKTLQTRLQSLLENRDGELSDLLAIERELARVNSEIDSTESYLRALRLRVSMSELSVQYETKLSSISPPRFNPLGEALGDFFWNLSSGLAGVITAFAVGLPWLILIGLFLWIWLRLIWPRIRRKKA